MNAGPDYSGTLVYYGDTLKALDDAGKVGGYLVKFGSPTATDASKLRDYFTKATDFGRFLKSGSLDLLFHHGLPKVGDLPNHLADRTLGDVAVKADDVGLWMEGVMQLRDEYEAKVYGSVKAGKMGLSSGVPAHMVRRAAQANGSHEVKRWPIVEASITPTPAEPRTAAVALKSLIDEGEVPSPSLIERTDRLVSDLGALKALYLDAAESREKEGRSLSAAKLEGLKALHNELGALIRAATPRPSAEDLGQLEAEFLAFEARYGGLLRP